jgi:lysylphosphatidylglycerol synthetase-like protein (DUF2156 family)
MGFLTSTEVIPHFEAYGFNSSHFVWLIGDFQYYRATSGLLFAFKIRSGILFLALEPLGPDLDAQVVNAGLQELHEELPHEIVVWVSIYESFSQSLKANGYETIPIGKEPWLDLSKKVATGKAARGVKAARNQALRSGCRVEEWIGSEVLTDERKSGAIQKILEEWSSRRKLFLGGYLNSTDPFAHRSYRKYFVGKDGAGQPRAYLIATQIPATRDYFLEDLVLGDSSPRGMGELLVLSACQALTEYGAERASLGVVSGVSRESEVFVKNASFAAKSLSRMLEKFYNLEGMEVFRKRFQPEEWQSVHIAVRRRDAKSLGTQDWFRIFWNLFLVFEPKVQMRYRLPHGRTSPHSVASQDSAELGA